MDRDEFGKLVEKLKSEGNLESSFKELFEDNIELTASVNRLQKENGELNKILNKKFPEKPSHTFTENRKLVQQAVEKEDFVIPVSENGELSLSEKNKNAKLKEVKIINIPTDDNRQSVWEVNLEIKNSLFTTTQKTCEKALLILAEKALYVFMFELKSSVHNDDDSNGSLQDIDKKFQKTIDRISLLLTINRHDDRYNSIKNICFKGLVFYNKDNVSVISSGNEHCSSLYKIFKSKKKGILNIKSPIREHESYTINFYKNPDKNKEVWEIDFKKIGGNKLKLSRITC